MLNEEPSTQFYIIKKDPSVYRRSPGEPKFTILLTLQGSYSCE